MLLSSRKDSHDYQLMPEVDLDTKQDLLIEKEVYSSFNDKALLQLSPAACSTHMHLQSRQLLLSSYAWHLLMWKQSAHLTAGKPSLEKVVREEGYDGLIITGVCTVGSHYSPNLLDTVATDADMMKACEL